MEGVDCSICFIPFSDNLVPKTLECGHSLCSPCITRLLEGKSECPTCSRKMTMENVDQYSTTYDLLNLINSVNKLKLGKDGLKSRIATLKRKFEDRLNSVTVENTFLQDGLCKLEEHNGLEGGDRKKSEEMVVKLEKEFLKICTNITHFQESIRIEDFAIPKEFLYEIYRRIREGEKVFAVHNNRNEMKYGQILSQYHKLLVHSLSTKPKEEDGEITVVEFGDIKQCRVDWKAMPFLTLSCGQAGLQRTVFIETNPLQPLLPQFLKLCSGEVEGRSYKGTSYREGGILMVSDYMRNGVAERGQFDYVANGEVVTKYKGRDVVVRASKEGTFDVLQLNQDCCDSFTIGKVVPPCDLQRTISFKDAEFNKILDCGLSLALR